MTNEKQRLLDAFDEWNTMPTSPLLRLVLSVLVLTVLPSCSSAFHKAWDHPPAAHGISGKWEGTWLSAVNGHHGELRCVVSGPKGGQNYRFHYHATWKSILSGSYKAIHQVQKKGTSYIFQGDHPMPDWAGGLYHYEGTVQGDAFNARYECAKDRGTFTMQRVR